MRESGGVVENVIEGEGEGERESEMHGVYFEEQRKMNVNGRLWVRAWRIDLPYYFLFSVIGRWGECDIRVAGGGREVNLETEQKRYDIWRVM